MNNIVDSDNLDKAQQIQLEIIRSLSNVEKCQNCIYNSNDHADKPQDIRKLAQWFFEWVWN